MTVQTMESPVATGCLSMVEMAFMMQAWRGAFGGGSIYVSQWFSAKAGNMPPSMAAQLFGIIPAGTVVYVYN